MTGAQFASNVKVKLNRLDTSAYEDVREEEVLFFGLDALKYLTLRFDTDEYKGFESKETIAVYLAKITKESTEIPLINNKAPLGTEIFKLVDVAVYVKVGTEQGWQPTRAEDNRSIANDTYNPFLKSFPDMPEYHLLDDVIFFHADGFTCEKVKYIYLEYPEVITSVTDLDFPFIMELENKTVTLILENLESRRIQTQPVVAKS